MAYVSKDDKAALSPAIKAVLKKFKMKGTISVNHHSTLVVKLSQGEIDFAPYMDGRDHITVNEFWIDQHYTGTPQLFLNSLVKAMKGPDYFDDSDAMTDYFHLSHYIDISIGRWNKPYIKL